MGYYQKTKREPRSQVVSVTGCTYLPILLMLVREGAIAQGAKDFLVDGSWPGGGMGGQGLCTSGTIGVRAGWINYTQWEEGSWSSGAWWGWALGCRGMGGVGEGLGSRWDPAFA